MGNKGTPSLRLCQAERVTRGSPLPLCQPPVGPVLTFRSPLVGGSVHADSTRSTVPHPHLPSMLTSGPPEAGLGRPRGGHGARDPDSRRLEGSRPAPPLGWACVWGLTSSCPRTSCSSSPSSSVPRTGTSPPASSPLARPEAAGSRRNPGFSAPQTCTPIPFTLGWGNGSYWSCEQYQPHPQGAGQA